MAHFAEIEKLILKFIQNCKGGSNRKNNIEKEPSYRTPTTYFKTFYYKVMVIKTMWCYHKDRH